ncbi:unnamed protein product [Parascedosporium putredinis]|uniref:Methyltransferase domain-containing protein n=1 Tax=Parascedosporium putredinis TaxID=1442378 RepID=A0A9P1H4M1_9PEZI|nr:unnamed protein product [Parascedosporium putredinis]CAI7996804.1 unnamed protein product [Parascedosporium putredinis]
MSDNAAPSQEKTFRDYTDKQGATYAQHRPGYHPRLWEILLNYHESSGGQFDLVLDVGCGPGQAVGTAAAHFTRAIGIDPSEGMLTMARVDLIVAATCAHWFNMAEFWPRAAQVLKPGGTVALWVSGPLAVDSSVPNAQRIRDALDRLHERLDGYFEPGNLVVRELYKDILLPWQIPTPVADFDKDSFVRQEWGTDAPGAERGDQYYETSKREAGPAAIEAILATMSPVTRWREAHPEAVGTEEDVVRKMRREMEQALYDGGVEKGKEVIVGGVSAVMLLVKKRSGSG